MLLAGIISMMLFVSAPSNQSVVGKWKTIDDKTNKAKSIVEIYKQDGKLYGKVVKLFKAPDEDQDPLCTHCEGALHNKRIIGLQIINGLEFDDGEWYADDGILDPDDGKLYDCKLWLDPENPDILQVRGYILFIYRTQTWHRQK